MSVQRLQIAKNKKSTSSKHNKREVASLLSKGKEEMARIKVEHIIREDFTIEAYEILELLSELLHERIRFISNSPSCPPDLEEAINSVIWASYRVDIAELGEVRRQFAKKFGSKFAKNAETNVEALINPRLSKKLSIEPPSASLVFKYLEEIAKEYNINWEPTEIGFPEDGINSRNPLPSPIGFSIPMAPGSDLRGVYERPNEPQPIIHPYNAPPSSTYSPPPSNYAQIPASLMPMSPGEFDRNATVPPSHPNQNHINQQQQQQQEHIPTYLPPPPPPVHQHLQQQQDKDKDYSKPNEDNQRELQETVDQNEATTASMPPPPAAAASSSMDELLARFQALKDD